jgi:hypothetical protein
MTARHFPRIFLLFYILYHLYVFIYPGGFSYLALLTLALFLQHTMYYFWYRYELPALYTGRISPRTPRMIAGDIIGHAIGVDSSVLSDSEFSTSAVVLEDEIEMSRRIQQQQMVDLFLAAELDYRQRHLDANRDADGLVTTRLDSPMNRGRRDSGDLSPVVSPATRFNPRAPTRSSFPAPLNRTNSADARSTARVVSPPFRSNSISEIVPTSPNRNATTTSRFVKSPINSAGILHRTGLVHRRVGRNVSTSSDTTQTKDRSESFLSLLDFASSN